jgi:epoxyqueuosine reductase
MYYMEKHGTKRSRPDKLMPGAIRVISFRMNYLNNNTYESEKVLNNKNLAYISRYALGNDYHSEMRNRLHIIAEKINNEIKDFKYRAFVDSAPVLEKAIAQKAGLGWIGKNTLLINKKNGSYFFLGEIYTNVDFETDEKSESYCGDCNKCITTCPTNAIIAPHVLDAKKCIAYLTIELKGTIPKEYRDSIGNRVFGCDDCQIVCPWNRFSSETKIEEFSHNNKLDSASLISLFNWSEKEFKENTKNTPINRISYFQWLRNISIGLGNSNKSIDVLDCLEKKKNISNDSLLIEHIDWAISKQKKIN